MKKIALVTLTLCFIAVLGCTSAPKYPSGVDFEQMGYFKAAPGEKGNKESGTVRVMTFYISNFKDDSQVWEDIEKHAKSQMWSQGGVTIIFYFNNKQNTPGDIITLAKNYDTALNFPESYNEYCVAGYWKYTNGRDEIIKYPLK
ncbi:MAG: hypothetical protein ACP5SP_07790 [Caldisericum sp.]|uniref:hypothetical protein n=1 Tax=Caldisericum sp. TaxID=2499687 RepID=UPI003D12921C